MMKLSQYWDVFVNITEDIGIIVGVLAGLIALLINWKAIFAPYKKKVEEEEFQTVKSLLKELLNPRFYYFYNWPVKRQDAVHLHSILVGKLISPFLPKEIYQDLMSFTETIFTALGTQLPTEETKNDIIPINQEEAHKRHKQLYETCEKLLKIEPKKFPFPLLKKS